MIAQLVADPDANPNWPSPKLKTQTNGAVPPVYETLKTMFWPVKGTEFDTVKLVNTRGGIENV